MNVVLVNKEEVMNGMVILTDHRAKHIVKVLRAEEGASLRVGMIRGKLGAGKVIKIIKKYPFHVELAVEFTSEPPGKTPVDLLLALPRPIMLRRIFSQAAALGFGTLHIVNANRVEKSFWNSGLLEKDEYFQQLIHGLEQAVDTIPPSVIFHRRFKPFIEDYFPAIAQQYSQLIYAHPEGDKRFHHILNSVSGKILLAIGPEGGWVEYEEMRFRERGFSAVSIGERILKVDTAVVNLHGRIMAELER